MQIKIPGGAKCELFPNYDMRSQQVLDRITLDFRSVVPVLQDGVWYGVFSLRKVSLDSDAVYHGLNLLNSLRMFYTECHVSQNNYVVNLENLTDYEEAYPYERMKFGLVFQIQPSDLEELARQDLIEYKYITKTL